MGAKVYICGLFFGLNVFDFNKCYKMPLFIPPALTSNIYPPIKKVLILGAECTGKSTLSRDLAKRFKTNFVPEYMRVYLSQKPVGYVCQYSDLLPIAIGQINSENRAILTANRYVFCDTALFEIMVYSHWYFGTAPSQMIDHINQYRYDMVLLTDSTGIDWVADGMRDLPHGRNTMRQYFVQFLDKFGIDYVPISGSRQTRVHKVMTLLKQNFG